jgi:hypothetical protein
MRNTIRAAVLVAAAGVISSAAGQTAGTTLAVAGRANATPTIAAAEGFVVVVWGATQAGGATDVYSAISRDSGRTFAMPVRVNDVGGDASLGGEQPPRVSLVPRAGRDPEIVVVWTAKAKDGTRLLVARSADGGTSFGRAAPLEGSGAPGNRGWESTTIDRSGRIVAIWLDHRESAAAGGMPPGMHHEGHDHAATGAAKADGAERAQLSKLYFARLDDPASVRAVTAGVCYCCKTAVATGPDGSIYAAWRHVYPGNIRDIAFTQSRDDGKTFRPPVRVSDDHWELDGCPENGPAMAVDARNGVHVVWPTLVRGPNVESEPTLGLFYAETGDGQTFSPRLRMATGGVPRHPQMIAGPAGSLAIVWDEETTSGRRVVLSRARVTGASRTVFSRELVSGSARAQYPVIARVPQGAVVAWTEGGDNSVIRVRQWP